MSPIQRTTAPVFPGILEMIGNTPMLELSRLDTGPCRLFAKMESMNPGNSIKDRIAVYHTEKWELAAEFAVDSTDLEEVSWCEVTHR